MATTLRPDRDVADTIDAIVWDGIQAPPFTLKAWNLAPADGVPFARYESFGSEAVGNVQTVVWGGADGRILWTVSFVAEERRAELAAAHGADAGPRGV
jgi:hypothetical protein